MIRFSCSIFLTVMLAAILSGAPSFAEDDPLESVEQEVSEPSLPSIEERLQGANQQSANDQVKLPEIQRDLSVLPFPTRRMHELILEATKTGDIERLRPLIGTGESATQLSLGGLDEDPVEFLKGQSGDEQGHEILAILEEVLEAGFVHLDKGTENEIFVWPYFFAYPLDRLDPSQRVELFRIVTYGDYADMRDFGGY
ncbi:MAG: hypothetical protein AAFN43_04620, partial [Pseudomonadota bacterium]